MQRIYVDIDDTMIEWLDADGNVMHGAHPYGSGAHGRRVNKNLLAALELFVQHSNSPPTIILWSGGGAQYAEQWFEEIFCSEYIKRKEQAIYDILNFTEKTVKLGSSVDVKFATCKFEAGSKIALLIDNLQPGDIVVDDMHIEVPEGVLQYTPQEFIDLMEA